MSSSDRRVDLFSSPGPVRGRNEDFVMVDDELGLYAVCDGGGGYDDERASVATSLLRGALHWRKRERRVLDGRDLQDALAELASAYKQHVESNAKFTGSSFTIAVVLWPPGEDVAFVACVGDSMAIMARQDGPHLLALPHTLARELIAAGERLPGNFFHSIITRAIGCNAECDVKEIVVNDDPIVLVTDGVCADGVDTPVALVDVGAIARTQREPARALVELACCRGTTDNATALVLRRA